MRLNVGRRLAVRGGVGIAALALALSAFALGTAPSARASGGCAQGSAYCVYVILDMPQAGDGEVYSSNNGVKLPGLIDCTKSNGLIKPSPCAYGFLAPAADLYRVDVQLHYVPHPDSIQCSWNNTNPNGYGDYATTFDLSTHPAGQTVHVQYLDFCYAVPLKLQITKSGTGQGKVTSSNSAINCGAKCRLTVATGAPIKLLAAAYPGSHFVRWTGFVCSGTNPACTVALDFSAAANAVFDANPATPAPTATPEPTASPPPPTEAPTASPAPTAAPVATPEATVAAPTPGPSPAPTGNANDNGTPMILLLVAAILVIGGVAFGLARRSRAKPAG